jgi:SAM-dependent methyltransferase
MARLSVQYFLEGLDFTAFEQLRHSTQGEHYSTRYGDARLWMRRALKEARLIGLVNSRKPLSILDLGTGPGYFPYICERLGHRCIGLDVPEGPPFCQGVHRWLGLTVVQHEIKAAKPLPDLGRFDLVTAFRAHFHHVRAEKRLWTLSEWSYFLDNLRDQVLSERGELILRLNRVAHMQETMPHTEEAFAALMAGRGAVKRGRQLRFAPLK